MNGPQAGALLLSLALVVGRPSPRRRLRPVASPRRRLPSNELRGAGWAAVGLGCAALVLLPLTTVLCIAVVGATVSLRYRRRRRMRRATREGRALETALDVLVGELRAGSHPVRAFGVAADETAGAVADSLRSVAARARLGADVAAGLAAASHSSALPAHWERLALCWRLASDNGLGIATLMRAAQRDIAERQRFSARVASSLAGARATAAILAALPVLGVLLGQLIGARPLAFLLGGHVGGWLLLIGSTLACGGLLWSDRIVDRVA
ncbi:type II secretion system F family protein [Mycobacterium intracellulare]|uniref:type II secretion system F family protein n=1 Tax=Mycobacterium intracellulare TaxID=1767 RepID=UPI001EEF626E|nr:type II secretion system F family protein [Mycobacterium intracellulare]MEE3752295.1 type II secretion system F family protein [Mycobacterium intracellulare]